jgi:hypothetical protein
VKQRLGEKKVRQIERLTGRKVMRGKLDYPQAWTRGGREHFWAEVWFDPPAFHGAYNIPPFVNYKTGEIEDGNGKKVEI